jgi:uncharacterized protein DUF6065
MENAPPPARAATTPTITVTIVPLVPNVALPHPASAHTRTHIPAGYGVQEQCLPFTAASALGFLIPSPIRFGLCSPLEVPQGCHPLRSPLDRPAGDGHFADPRVLYVADHPDCRFRGNAYEFEGIPVEGSPIIREPGLSFFDRADQQDLFKLHLPYVWRTPEMVDTLFLPLLNRSDHGLEVQSGLVETDWYASPVNLVLRKPPAPVSVHFGAGDPVALAILLPRQVRRPALEVAPSHARLSRETRKSLAEWDKQHARDRSAYKTLARSRHGRIESESCPVARRDSPTS